MDHLRIEGFSRLDALDLVQDHPDARIDFEEAVPRDAEHGELATVALVAVTIAGLQALAAWLLKDRKQGHLERKLEMITPDGARRTETLRIHLSESTSQADVLRELGQTIGVDLSTLDAS